MNETDQNNDIQPIDESVGQIDPSVLNTPAKEPEKSEIKVPTEKSTETFFEINKPQTRQPKDGLILDLDGKQTPVGEPEGDLDTRFESIQDLLGESFEEEGTEISPNAFLLIGAILIGLIVFIVFNLKKSEHIFKLEKEVENLKKGKITGLK